jgi:50S ribosomal subunit-associated GTPase HflX
MATYNTAVQWYWLLQVLDDIGLDPSTPVITAWNKVDACPDGGAAVREAAQGLSGSVPSATAATASAASATVKATDAASTAAASDLAVAGQDTGVPRRVRVSSSSSFGSSSSRGNARGFGGGGSAAGWGMWQGLGGGSGPVVCMSAAVGDGVEDLLVTIQRQLEGMMVDVEVSHQTTRQQWIVCCEGI